MKRFFIIISLLFFIHSLNAGPVFRITKTVKQSDGSSIVVTRVGADHLLYYITADGIPVYPDSNNDYCYAVFDDSGNVAASAVLAHDAAMRTPAESRMASEMSDSFFSFTDMRRMSRYGVGSLASASVKSMGDVRVAVILAEFKDLAFKEENDIERFNNHFNASSYTQEGGAGSVRDYFIAQSDSLFRPSFDIVAKVKVSENRSYYGRNSGGNDLRARAYISEATDSAVAKGVDFSKYLNDKGELFVIVIFPGHGEQVSGESSQLWASYYFSMSHTVGGIKLTSGLVMDELADYGLGEMFDGIGTLCHEFSHAIGLPDFYNTTSANNIFGMDAWSIMDYGQFNNLSRTPVGYTSYEREFMGWLKVDTLHNFKQKVTLAPLHSKEKHRALRIPNPADKTGNEYYLLENRQESPWYMKLYGEGMLVLHVDYNANSWASNTINNNYSHQRMTIIPADNMLTRLSSKASDYKGDPFPGLRDVTEFSATTTPATKVYNGGVLDIKLKDIHEVNDSILFFYQCDGQLDTPRNLRIGSLSDSSVSLSFDTVSNAEYYTIQTYQGETLISTDTASVNGIQIDNLNSEITYTIFVTAAATNYLDSTPVSIKVTPISYAIADVNRDGEVNTSDVVALYNYIANGEGAGISLEIADVNRDGEVNTSDVVALYNYIANGESSVVSSYIDEIK